MICSNNITYDGGHYMHIVLNLCLFQIHLFTEYISIYYGVRYILFLHLSSYKLNSILVVNFSNHGGVQEGQQQKNII